MNELKSTILILSVLAAACAGQSNGAASSVAQAQPKPSAAPSKAQNASPAAKLVAAYLTAQEALAADDAAAARTAMGAVKESATAQVITDATLLARVTKAASTGAAAKDLEGARKAFGELSAALLDWLKAQPSPAAETLHVAFCPMAFGTGAKWLQRSDKVSNPYYGSEMLRCGSIDAELKPGSKLSK
jgi:membrane fusion protein, copper/silver efflux system